MTRTEFQTCLNRLGLSQTEAARLLSVSPRTVRRWAEKPPEIPGPAEQALRAWMQLHRLGLPWRPDGVAIGQIDPEQVAEQIAIYREHLIGFAKLLRKVDDRGGPAAPWHVNLKKRQATLGPIRVSFYSLRDGGFSPQSYSRNDGDPDLERDQTLLEDAYACIANAIAKAGSDWAKSETNLTAQQ